MLIQRYLQYLQKQLYHQFTRTRNLTWCRGAYTKVKRELKTRVENQKNIKNNTKYSTNITVFTIKIGGNKIKNKTDIVVHCVH